MIPGLASGKIIAEMQQEMLGLQQQLASLSEQIAALASQTATEAKRALAAASDIEIARRDWSKTEAMALQNSTILAGQSVDVEQLGGRVDQLGKRMDQHDEALRKVQGSLSRIQKQAAADLEEIRGRDASLMAMATHLAKSGKDA